MKIRKSDRIRNLGGNNRIDEFWDTGFILSIDDEEDMSVRETIFLEFDDIYMSDNFTEYTLLRIEKLFQEYIKFDLEYSRDDIRSILDYLIILKEFSDLTP
jgi:hypothetical protein